MLRIEKIQSELLNLVGWEQSDNPEFAIDENLARTESGLFFQNAHPLVTLKNIASIAPEINPSQFPDWGSETPYKKGDRVKHDCKIWEANVGTTNDEPGESDEWSIYNPLSSYLLKLTKSGIAQTIQTFLQMKSLKEETKTLLERRTFFDGAGRLSAFAPNNHKTVGFEIVPVRAIIS